MPNNRIIYWGIVLLVVTVLLWIGAELTKRIEWALPYAGSVGVAMVVGGFIYELWKSRTARPSPFKKEEKPD
jgi:hypothetical protein